MCERFFIVWNILSALQLGVRCTPICSMLGPVLEEKVNGKGKHNAERVDPEGLAF